MENDSDEGEDKISKKARLEQLEPMEVVQHYTISYHKAMEHLNCLPPSIEPRATGHIIEQIEMIKKIITNGYAYEVNGSVYLDVKKYNKDYNYGVLSGRNLEDTLEGTRKLDGQNEKRSHVDFAIWKNASKEHIMKWPSPWGTGFPGWHMECSAMSEKYLGKTFDIHGGGNDLTFPHHEAEITQSNAAHGCAPVKYWMHNNMITIDGKKMGKSLGNFITLSDFFNGNHYKLEQAYSPMTIRFFILQAHYRGTLDFSNNALKASSKGLNKLMDSCETILKISSSKNTDFNIQELEDKCYASMNDDFNTPILISHLFEGVKIINSLNDGKAKIDADNLKKLKELFQFFIFDILGLKSSKDNRGENTTNEIMDLILKLRKKAKISKDFETADLIRDDLNNVGIEIKDGRDGSSWHAKSK